MSTEMKNIDFLVLRERLDQAEGPEVWRSLEALAETEEFQRFAAAEFPTAWDDASLAAGRRDFLKLMGASFGLAGLGACVRQPEEKIIPYVRAPEEMIPGSPRFYATALSQGGYGTGVLVESHMGRPTRVDGNPEHPASLGAADVFMQAAILELYDPERSQSVRYRGAISTRSRFVDELMPELEALRERGGRGLRVLTGAVGSPTLGDQLQRLLRDLPEARWHQWEAVSRDNALAGAAMAFGRPLETQLRLEDATVLVSFEADFMGTMPGKLRYAREFMRGRSYQWRPGVMFRRLYAVESTPSLTGSVADHRIRARSADVGAWLEAVAAALGVEGARREQPGVDLALAESIAADLRADAQTALVVVGDAQPPEVHALGHAVNAALGSVGRTVTYTPPVLVRPAPQTESLAELARAMDAGEVEVLVVIGKNPLYDAPGDLEFQRGFEKVRLRVHLGLHVDETAQLSHWHLPERHPFEGWSDARAFDGTVTVAQPMIAPLYTSVSQLELVAMLRGEIGASDHDLVRRHWQAQAGGDFERTWRRALHDGFLVGSAFEAETPSARAPSMPPRPAPGLELTFHPDPSIWDGRFSNNAWLQELPRPLTKLTWGNAALVSPRTAEGLQVRDGDVVAITVSGRTVEAPVMILPGQADDSIALTLGYGRTAGGRVGRGFGYDANRLRSAASPWRVAGAELRKVGRREPLVSTQDHFSMENRHLVRMASLERYASQPDFAKLPDAMVAKLSLYPEYEYTGTQWGMSINLTTCIGCNACVIACQAENNIPVVGKEQVATGREMHWLRIDRYFQGSIDEPEVHWQPLPCMHCERAPCEVVCPVNATVHGPDGLNEMVYNRCVGTRYCSNNCPYKVRRFNYLLYADWETPSLKAQRNPDVTVRSRGVMEKCTYCVQRISEGRIAAKKQNREIRDGEVQTACQVACPTQAITFGNINDPQAAVAVEKASPLTYSLLEELNTKPRTTYVAKLRNPNPKVRRG